MGKLICKKHKKPQPECVTCAIAKAENDRNNTKEKCAGCGELFDPEELNDEGFCCEECQTLFENPRLLKL